MAVKKEAKKKVAKKKKEEFTYNLHDTVGEIADIYDTINDELTRYEEKGVAACLGRINKGLQRMKKLSAYGRKKVKEIRIELKAKKEKAKKKK